jgi:hypothetical protein
MSHAIACVYALADPRTGKIYYVGQTINLRRRLATYQVRIHGSQAFREWYDQMQGIGGPEVMILEEDPPDGLLKAEARWITRCLKAKEPLLNLMLPTPRQLRLPLFMPLSRRELWPFRRWRKGLGLGVGWCAVYCDVTASFIERIELGWYEVMGQTRDGGGFWLKRVVRRSGLSPEAIMSPERYIREHPEYLSTIKEKSA